MAKRIDDGSEKALVTAHATKPASQRKYPIYGPEARDVAIRRLAYRDVKGPIEFEIWQEFRQFPDVLAAYVGPATSQQLADFEERYRYNREQAERRIYGRVLTDPERGDP